MGGGANLHPFVILILSGDKIMDNLTIARNKMFEAIDITNAISAAFNVQFDAIKAYDQALFADKKLNR